jgi:hypothetical protein
VIKIQAGPAMVEAVSHLSPTVKAWVRAWESPCGFVVDNKALGQISVRVLRFSPVNIIPAWLSMRIYELSGEQYARLWPHFRDMVSPH